MPARRRAAGWCLVVTCEHGGRRVPRPFASLFAGRERALASHRGFDPGALFLARRLAGRMEAPLVATTVSRLLVDTNRSEHHRELHAPWIRRLPRETRLRILERHYRPHRDAVESAVARGLRAGGRVLHLAVHSFTPRLRGVARGCDVGLLYDPHRASERALCRRWRASLIERLPAPRVRLNHPYRGSDDGLTTALRRCWPGSRYAGVELEVSQRLLEPGSRRRSEVARALEETLRRLVPGKHFLL